jgi:hypothetical protein
MRFFIFILTCKVYVIEERRGPSAKAIPSLWIKLPDINQAKVIFVKEKLRDGFMFPQ